MHIKPNKLCQAFTQCLPHSQHLKKNDPINKMTKESNADFQITNSMSCLRDHSLNLMCHIPGRASESFALCFLSPTSYNSSTPYDFIFWANRLEAAIQKRHGRSWQGKTQRKYRERKGEMERTQGREENRKEDSRKTYKRAEGFEERDRPVTFCSGYSPRVPGYILMQSFRYMPHPLPLLWLLGNPTQCP